MKKQGLILNSQGMSIIEALGGLALISLVIAITTSSARHIFSLQYGMDSRIIDQHFNRIHRILSYGNCDSFIGDKLTSSNYVNTPDTGIRRQNNQFPEIKIRSPLKDSVTGREKTDSSGKPIYEYYILYAVKDNKVEQQTYGSTSYEPVETLLKDSHISIKSMSLEKDSHFKDHARLKVTFFSRRAKKLKESGQGEFERSLKIYTSLKNGTIESCELSPPECKAESKKVFMIAKEFATDSSGNTTVTITNCVDGAPHPSTWPSISIPLGKGLSGESLHYERITNHCACNFSFDCQDGVWLENLICRKRRTNP